MAPPSRRSSPKFRHAPPSLRHPAGEPRDPSLRPSDGVRRCSIHSRVWSSGSRTAIRSPAATGGGCASSASMRPSWRRASPDVRRAPRCVGSPRLGIRAPGARCRPSRPLRPRAGSRLERLPAGERGAGPRRMGDALHRAAEHQVCRATGAGAKAGPSGRRGPVGKRRVRVCAVGVSTRGVPLTQGTRGAPARRTSSRSVMLSMVSSPTSRPVASTTGRAGSPLARRRSSAS